MTIDPTMATTHMVLALLFAGVSAIATAFALQYRAHSTASTPAPAAAAVLFALFSILQMVFLLACLISAIKGRN